MRHRALAAAVALCLAIPSAVAIRPAGSEPPPTYVAPVDAPVVDPFRPPSSPFGPGNRGLEYGTDAGAEVRAAADGVVTFAGLVAGTRHVTVLHPDGLRTSYSYLDRVDVVVGQHVEQGHVLGTTTGHL
ncbi:MAG: murein hydrolase activator EnvC family protein, partial [Acidimicrobiales bacterium]